MYATHGSDAGLGIVVKAAFSKLKSIAVNSRKSACAARSNQSALR
jgi:hypothetical protein